MLGDSILHGYFDHDQDLRDKLKKEFDLDLIVTDFQGGITTSKLVHRVFPRKMAEFINSNDCEILVDVFLISGAVDLSDALSDDCQIDLEDFISNRNAELKTIMEDPFVRRLIVFPLTPRRACQNDLSFRFPKYAEASWIMLANRCIRDINTSNWNFHTKLRHVPPLPTKELLLAKDGIHLDKEGKKAFSLSVLQVCEKTIISMDEFPPLQESKIKAFPLQAIDQNLAQFEEKKRKLKKEKETAKLIDMEPITVKTETGFIFKGEKRPNCSPM